MSHTANLRRALNAQHAAATPAKRRKLSTSAKESPDSLSAILNGHTNGSKLAAQSTYDAKTSKKRHVDESAVQVGAGNDDASMLDAPEDAAAESDQVLQSDNNDESDAEGGALEAAPAGAQQILTNGDSTADEPSFGDLLRARGSELIDVNAALTTTADTAKSMTQTPANRILSVPTATSLGTVLTQALKTNDVDLLESCLQVTNLDSIRATIERLHSALAANLLQKLAERMHKRPGRAGSLMVWVQWTVVAHGGYLASQPAAMKQLNTLYQVVRQRAVSLQPLLALKGKLDMLEAQLQLRRNMQARSRKVAATEEDEGVIYIEGEEEGNNGGAMTENLTNKTAVNGKASRKLSNAFDDSEDDEAMPNGVDSSDMGQEEVDLDSADEEDMGLIDDEAEETDADSGEEELSDENIDYDDIDDEELSGSGEEEDEEELPPARKSKAKKLSKH